MTVNYFGAPPSNTTSRKADAVARTAQQQAEAEALRSDGNATRWAVRLGFDDLDDALARVPADDQPDAADVLASGPWLATLLRQQQSAAAAGTPWSRNTTAARITERARAQRRTRERSAAAHADHDAAQWCPALGATHPSTTWRPPPWGHGEQVRLSARGYEWLRLVWLGQPLPAHVDPGTADYLHSLLPEQERPTPATTSPATTSRSKRK